MGRAWGECNGGTRTTKSFTAAPLGPSTSSGIVVLSPEGPRGMMLLPGAAARLLLCAFHIDRIPVSSSPQNKFYYGISEVEIIVAYIIAMLLAQLMS